MLLSSSGNYIFQPRTNEAPFLWVPPLQSGFTFFSLQRSLFKYATSTRSWEQLNRIYVSYYKGFFFHFSLFLKVDCAQLWVQDILRNNFQYFLFFLWCVYVCLYVRSQINVKSITWCLPILKNEKSRYFPDGFSSPRPQPKIRCGYYFTRYTKPILITCV